MADVTRCARCGRGAEPGSAEFLDWQITDDDAVICPRCLTPREHAEHGDSAFQTGDREDEILRRLDPDTDQM